MRDLLDPFERTQRVVYPDHRMWVRGGSVLAELSRRHSVEPTKRRMLANHTLIALSAISIGAAVVTFNARDFTLLARVIPLTWFGSVEEALTPIA